MRKQIFISLKFLAIMTVITGIIYPVFLTGIAQVVFPEKSNGSLITKNGVIIGSGQIGQKFDSVAYFWSRPSAVDYNPIPSAGSNFGPTSTKLANQVQERKSKFIANNEVKDTTLVPLEMIFASGSGLDPHISPEAAIMQVERIARVRNFNSAQKQKVHNLIDQYAEKRQFGILGEEKINVLKLNMGLDAIN
jgi:potassium-transporting ATPase KdpC subunit